MRSLQIRDMPDDVYEALAERAQQQQRSVEQQVIADLAGISEAEARQRRHAAIEWLRQAGPAVHGDPLDPVELIREDRDR